MSETRGSTVLDCGCVVLLDFDRVGAFSRFTFEWCALHSAAEEMRELLGKLVEHGRECVNQFDEWDAAETAARALLARLERTP